MIAMLVKEITDWEISDCVLFTISVADKENQWWLMKFNEDNVMSYSSHSFTSILFRFHGIFL